MATQTLPLNKNNYTYDYLYQTQASNGQKFYTGWRYTYNGVPVVYVPKEYVDKGLYKDGTQYYSPAFLNKDIYNYLKPATLDPSDFTPTGAMRTQFGSLSNPFDGYIIDESKYKEFNGAQASIIPTYSFDVAGSSKDNMAIQGITEQNGKLVYAGLRGSPSESGEYSTYDSSGQSTTKGWHKSSGILAGLGESIASIGPASLLLNFAVPGLGTAVYAGTKLGQGIATGNIGQIVTAAAAVMLPGLDGAPPVINVPGVSDIVGTISNATGLSTATSGALLQSGLDYAATGGDIGTFLKGQLASALGAQAGGFVDKLVGSAGFSGMNTIAKAVASNTTKALLLNQDVSKAATNAFADTAVPLALKNTPGWDKLSTAQQTAATNGAISAAKGGQLDVGAVIKNYTTDVFSDAAIKAIPGSDKWTAAQTKLAKDTISAGVQGKSLDGPLQSYMINQAKMAVTDQVAKAEGWASDAQKQAAQGQYGSAIKPDEYTAKQQGWEDLAAKQAAIKSYGDTITPVGVKEREQVKGIDPKFDAEAYAKLNEVTGDPFQHFLTQGSKAQLPTNYESGADAALKSIGYKASPDEIKQVADLFKQSADPDVALGKFYDEHWVTQEEAAAAAKQAGFDLTPEQLKTFVGQTTGGQNTVLEDVARAAKIGQTAQQQRTKFVDSQMADVMQAYKDQGYSDAQINAALPAIRNSLSTAIDQKVSQAADYANQTKASYGENSKEYAAAQKQLLETQAAVGGTGVVKNGTNFETLSGETRSADTPTKADTWMQDKTKAPATVTGGDQLSITGGSSPNAPSGVFDASGKQYSIGEYRALPNNATIYDAQGKASTLSSTAIEIAGTQQSQLGTLLQLGQTSPEKLLPGPLAALFGGQTGGGADTGTGFSLIGKTGAGDSVYGKAGSDFSLINFADGKTKAVNPRTQEVYLVPPAQVPPALPKPTPTTPVIPPPPVAPTKDPVADAVKAAQKAADEGRISQAEAEKLLTQAGYKYTPEEVTQFTGAYTPEQAQAAVTNYLDPRMVTEAEVRKAYQEAGLQAPTQADINRFIGQREQALLAPDIKTYLPTASANVMTEQASAIKTAQDAAAAKQAADQAAAKAAADQAAAKQAESIQTAVSQLGASTTQQFGDVNARIVELMRQGKDYQTATTQAQTELKQGQAQLGTKVGELGTQVGQIGTKVGDLGTTLGGQIAGLGNQLTAAKQQATQAQQQANMGTLLGLLGGFGGQQAPTPAPQPTPLANIGYVYDIGGKSIFANPQQEKAFVSPYAEGGTVEDLMKILRG